MRLLNFCVYEYSSLYQLSIPAIAYDHLKKKKVTIISFSKEDY